MGDKRSKGTGPSDQVQFRIKQTSFDSVQNRLSELDVNLSDYLRTLVQKDIGVKV
jgi:hypothetical protein